MERAWYVIKCTLYGHHYEDDDYGALVSLKERAL